MLLHLLGQEVAPGDLELLLVGIGAQLDDLHPVQQRPGDGVSGVGCGDKQDLAEVHRDLQEVVPEGVVLLAVQHLQQRRGGIAPVVHAQFVDLIQHQQRVHGAAAADGVDDTAGHGAYVGLAVAPDLRLVVDAAQTQAAELPVEGLGHGDGDGGFAHARRSHQADDLPPGIRIHLLDGNEFQDPLLDLVQPVVVPVQDLPGRGHIGPHLGGHVPGHIQAHVQVVADHRALGTSEGLLGKAVDLLEELFLHFFVELGRFDPIPVVLELVIIIFLTQLPADHLHLLPKNVILLHLSYVLADLSFNLLLKIDNVNFSGEQLIHPLQAHHRP